MAAHFSYKELADKIKEIFLTQDKYKMFKHVEEFKEGSDFLGDYFIFVIFESSEGEAPTFYTVCSPYDLVSKKAPEQAMVFKNGELILDTDFTHYTAMRTGVMDPLVARALGHSKLESKNILYVGTGHIAVESLRSLKELFPQIKKVDFYNRTQDPKEFGRAGKELGIEMQCADLSDIGKYDFIFCHTSSSEPVLVDEHLPMLKQGVFITTFISSTEKGEVSEVFYDTDNANVIMDFEQTPSVAKELGSAIVKKRVDKNKIILLKDLFENKFSINPNAEYTIYRSTGTPMQNVAVLKLLLNR